MIDPRPYDPQPHYSPVGRNVRSGWAAAVASLPARPVVLALDGPAGVDWGAVVGGLSHALAERGRPVSKLDIRRYMASPAEIEQRTTSAVLDNDPDFATLPTRSLADVFDSLANPVDPPEGVLVVFGPGAALVDHDVLWYADVPKRYSEAAMNAGSGRNLGQRSGSGSTRRMFYIDWPLLDRHRDALAPRIDYWIDTQTPANPTSIDGDTLRATAAALVNRPFRSRPTFNSTPWGGHWAQRQLGFNPEAHNTALGYELIAPESGVLIGGDGGPMVEVPLQLVTSLHPQTLLGRRGHATFGTSFPIRFDYLDTVDGGNLSVHCHPRSEYMRTHFGWPYTQHESYYVMISGDASKVFLGLRQGVDLSAFHEAARAAEEDGQALEIERYVQTFPAKQHRLFLIPAGTPHGSGEGNVVLEISATPYLYSLRFYDWLRRDQAGNQRRVHVEHAFRNVDVRRAGAAVARDLMQTPHTLRAGDGWREEVLGSLPEMFFEIRRMVINSNASSEDDTSLSFHVLNVVDGHGVLVETAAGHQQSLAYAETLVVPASVGVYTMRPLGRRRTRVVKALLR